jgi:hypothetical protein
MSRAQNKRIAGKQWELAPRARARRLGLASGAEMPIRSPALELQEALESRLMFLASRSPPRPIIATSVGVGLMAVALACTAFWVAVGQLLLSLA